MGHRCERIDDGNILRPQHLLMQECGHEDDRLITLVWSTPGQSLSRLGRKSRENGLPPVKRRCSQATIVLATEHIYQICPRSHFCCNGLSFYPGNHDGARECRELVAQIVQPPGRVEPGVPLLANAEPLATIDHGLVGDNVLRDRNYRGEMLGIVPSTPPFSLPRAGLQNSL